MVGPGIGRGEYGGFLMSLPARRMFDVWKDPDYTIAESKAERLLLAGLDGPIGNGMTPSVELGLGGGARIGVILRRATGERR